MNEEVIGGVSVSVRKLLQEKFADLVRRITSGEHAKLEETADG